MNNSRESSLENAGEQQRICGEVAWGHVAVVPASIIAEVLLLRDPKMAERLLFLFKIKQLVELDQLFWFNDLAAK